MIDITKEFSELRQAIKMGYSRGRQKALETAFERLEKAILEAQPKRPWWKLWGRDKVEV